MFEQPLYEFEPAAAPLEDSDLFRNYEIKSWVLSPRIIKIVALSAVVNIVALLVVGQTSLLTLKGCDSPLVGSVCQVLDTVYVGALLFGTDREYVDVAYDKTDLGDDEEITYIDVSNVLPPFEYPGDYFRIANPEKYVIPEIGDELAYTQGIPGIPDGLQLAQPSDEGLFDTPQKVPTPNPNVLEGDLGGGNSYNNGGVYFPPVQSYKPPRRGGKKPKPSPTPEDAIPGIPDENLVAENESPTPSATPTPGPTVDPTGPVDANAINTRPLKDTLAKVIGLLDQKQLDLQAPVRVVATAKLAKDGKIAKGTFRVAAPEGDKQLGIVVAETLAAFNDSNLLSYLGDLGGKDLAFLVEQDLTNVRAAIKSQVETPEKANTLATAARFSLGLVIGKKEKKIKELEALNDPTKAAELQSLRDDLTLLKSIQPSTNGKEFIVGFVSDKPLVQQWIQARLAEQHAEPKPTEATGGVPKPPADPAVK